MIRAVLFALLLTLALPVFANAAFANEGVEATLPDPAAEARVREIGRSLRCLVCQNQSIEDSNAPLARDLRQIVREHVAAGDSDAAIRDFMVARYGDWVLLKPPFKPETVVLWVAPFLILVIGAFVVFRLVRRQPTALPQALTPEEEARIARLLDQKEGGA